MSQWDFSYILAKECFKLHGDDVKSFFTAGVGGLLVKKIIAFKIYKVNLLLLHEKNVFT